MKGIKKRKTKSNLEKLQDKAEKAWKDYAYARDGKRCMVQTYDSSMPIQHSDIFQVDHCFSRSDKNLFLEPANATVICSTCNMLKGFGQRDIDFIVHQIVIKREGQAKHDQMMLIHQHKNPSDTWKSFTWLEQHIIKLNEMTKDLMSTNNLKEIHDL